MMIPLVRPSQLGLFDEIVAGVSTRIGGVSALPLEMNTGRHANDTEDNVKENRRLFCNTLGFDSSLLATQHQVHGDRISFVTAPCSVESNDALITNAVNVFLGVSVADCQPVLLYDRRQRLVAAVHAGWRGAAAHIVRTTVARMIADNATNPDDVYAYVGPCASACCYEVDASVAAQFDAAYLQPHGEGHFMLDLKSASRDELRTIGVPAAHIELSPFCTICAPEFFHSHRRDGTASGRMMAVIGMRKT